MGRRIFLLHSAQALHTYNLEPDNTSIPQNTLYSARLYGGWRAENGAEEVPEVVGGCQGLAKVMKALFCSLIYLVCINRGARISCVCVLCSVSCACVCVRLRSHTHICARTRVHA